MSVTHFEKIVAFIPSAGLGTRLKPLTNSTPKALVHFMGYSMLEGVLARLTAVGITKFIVNVHHFPEKMMAAIAQLNAKYDIRISDEATCLLDTGGGVLQAIRLLSDNEQTLLVHNVDVYAGFNLQHFIQSHLDYNNDITFAVSNRSTARKLVFNQGRLCGWVNEKTADSIGIIDGYRFAFSGIHLVNKAAFANAADKAFPLIPYYLSLMQRFSMRMFEHNSDKWFDLGTVKRISDAESTLIKNKDQY